MLLTEKLRADIHDLMSILRVVAGLVLLAALSREIITGDHIHLSSEYLAIQLGVCLFFLVDFFVRWAAATPHSYFLLRNIGFLLISIPYLNILAWSGAHLSHDWQMLIGLMPMARAFLAFYIVVQWLVSDKVSMLLSAYIFTVVTFTYLSALVFYSYEALVNEHLHGFGDALWWAWMNVTTVGAEIFAVTPIGKIITVLLPTLGMMMFPVFTTYVLQQYTRHSKKKPDA